MEIFCRLPVQLGFTISEKNLVVRQIDKNNAGNYNY